MISKKSATGSALTTHGPPAMSKGQFSSRSFERKGMPARSSIYNTFEYASSYDNEKPSISKFLSGIFVSMLASGKLFSLRY